MTTILIIDDEPAIAEVVAEVLTDEGFLTLTAPNGHAALSMLAEQRPDLMLLDVFMPGMSGLDLLARLKGDAALAGIPVVMMSAGAFSDNQLNEQGAAQVISKPFDVDQLVQTVRTLV